jgi:putative holliday junction resolvase
LRVMALDYGSRRIGVAISDELGTLASPVTVLRRSTRARDLQAVRVLVEQFHPRELLVGLPLLPSGDPGPQARQSELFADFLRREIGLPVGLWNESYSTVEAWRRRQDLGRRRADPAPIDAEAAAVFLQDYLDTGR